jgi:hypothetical protein
MQSQYWSIERLPGLTPPEQKLLRDFGIEDTRELLKRTNTLEKKQVLANKLQVEQKRLYKWVALADLARIPSVNYQYCGLLLHAGIVSVLGLSQTPFHRLHPQIVRLQVATLGRKDLSPPVEQVKKWVDSAKNLCTSRN